MTLYLERPFLRAILCSATILTLLTSHVPAREDDEDDNHGQATSGTQLATGQYITPTVIVGSVQQPLNPGLPAYPDFLAGEGGNAKGRVLTLDISRCLHLLSNLIRWHDRLG
jgi:hypothetical protein